MSVERCGVPARVRARLGLSLNDANESSPHFSSLRIVAHPVLSLLSEGGAVAVDGARVVIRHINSLRGGGL